MRANEVPYPRQRYLTLKRLCKVFPTLDVQKSSDRIKIVYCVVSQRKRLCKICPTLDVQQSFWKNQFHVLRCIATQMFVQGFPYTRREKTHAVSQRANFCLCKTIIHSQVCVPQTLARCHVSPAETCSVSCLESFKNFSTFILLASQVDFLKFQHCVVCFFFFF